MNHTKEPWATEYRKDHTGYSQQIFDASGECIAKMAWYPVRISFSTTVTNREENARRIVACVNACADVDNETLVKIASGEMDGSEIIELAKLKKAVLEFIDSPTGLNKERMCDMCI